MSLLPPPEAIYPDPNTAQTAIQLPAKQHGYAFFRISLVQSPQESYLPVIVDVNTTLEAKIQLLTNQSNARELVLRSAAVE
jgi:hypothetical protein